MLPQNNLAAMNKHLLSKLEDFCTVRALESGSTEAMLNIIAAAEETQAQWVDENRKALIESDAIKLVKRTGGESPVPAIIVTKIVKKNEDAPRVKVTKQEGAKKPVNDVQTAHDLEMVGDF